MPVIIFEGVQGVGKTALIDELCKQGFCTNLKLPRTVTISRSHYFVDMFKNTMKALKVIKDAAKQQTISVVDRFIASEYAFGHTVKRENNDDWIFNVDKVLAEHNVRTWYITTKLDDLCRNIWHRRQAFIAELIIETIPEVSDWYADYFTKTKMKHFVFDNKMNKTIVVAAAELKLQIQQELMQKHIGDFVQTAVQGSLY